MYIGSLIIYASTPTKTIVPTAGTWTEILPVAYAYVHANNYAAANAIDRRGVNISWTWDGTVPPTLYPSSGSWGQATFTFDTPMADTNYNVITDREYEDRNIITMATKSTTGFTVDFVEVDSAGTGGPDVYSSTLIVYASTPTKTTDSTSSREILPAAYAYIYSCLLYTSPSPRDS